MIKFSNFVFCQFRKNYIWVIVVSAIVLNYLYRLLIGSPGPPIEYYTIPFFKDIRYGDYLIQKWFLIVIAFFVLFINFFLYRVEVLKLVKKSLPFLAILACVFILTHFLSFNRWFEFDDYRVIGHHYAVDGTKNQNQLGANSSYWYGIGMIYLVVGLFKTNFYLYNAWGLLIYFFVGVMIFFIANKLQNNKFISLLVATFFVTSPTYYRQTLLMLELMGDGFKLLLFAISVFLLLSRFYAGSIIFAASALEFGLSRTHFIALTLLTIVWLFGRQQIKPVFSKVIVSIFFIMASLQYLNVLNSHSPTSVDKTNVLNNWTQLIRIVDMFFGVMIPHGIVYPLIHLLRWFFDDSYYISTICGLVLVTSLVLLIVISYKREKILAMKMLIVGLFTSIGAIIFPTLMGIRLVYDIKKLTIQYDDFLPAAPTAYGVFSTFGTVFIILALFQLFRFKTISLMVILLIIINTATVLKSDQIWIRNYSTPQKTANQQLLKILPYDGQVKVIYTPSTSAILSRYIDYFYQLYRIKDPLYFTNDPVEFIKLVEKYKPNSEGIFLLTIDRKNYMITDHSLKLREKGTSFSLAQLEEIYKSK